MLEANAFLGIKEVLHCQSQVKAKAHWVFLPSATFLLPLSAQEKEPQVHHGGKVSLGCNGWSRTSAAIPLYCFKHRAYVVLIRTLVFGLETYHSFRMSPSLVQSVHLGHHHLFLDTLSRWPPLSHFQTLNRPWNSNPRISFVFISLWG